MALDTNIPMMGKGIDTANPLQQLGQTLRQNKLDTMAAQTNKIDTASKANLYTMQVMSAGAAGGQASYDAAKQHIQSMGLPIDGWANDAATGATQAKALQTALIPPVAMMNAGINQQKADAATAATNGTIAPGPAAVMPATGNAPQGPVTPPTGQVDPSAPGMQLPGATPAQPQDQQAAPQAAGQDALPQVPDQDQATRDKLVNEHFSKLPERDQSRIQNVAIAAAQVKPFLDSGDVQGALQYAQKRQAALHARMGAGENIDDTDTAAFIKMLQAGDVEGAKQHVDALVQVGQTVGALPKSAAQGFTPSQGPANENPGAKEKRIANELAVYKANVENDPTHAATMKDAETEATNAADYKKGLIGQVSEGEGSIRIINAQEKLLDSFKSGAWTTQKAEAANMAASLGAPDFVVKGIAGGDPAAVQAFEGLASQHALLQLKSLMNSGDGTGGKIGQREFLAFKEDLANPNKMDGAIRAINQMQKDAYAASSKELSALTQWENDGKPISKFRQNYAQTVNKELTQPSQSGTGKVRTYNPKTGNLE